MLKSVIGKTLFLRNCKAPLIQKRNFIVVIDQATIAYRQFLGSNRVRLEPGLRLNIPIIHDLRKVDMREGRTDVSKLLACTKDNILVHVTGTLFYKVNDAEKACFGVQDYLESVTKVGTSTIRSVLGRFDYDRINSDRNTINVELVQTVGNSIKEWGVECTRFEIQSCYPESAQVAKQLELQMEAERLKRKNELDTEAHIRTAEGQKRSVVLASEGHLESRKNQAEGDFIIEKRKADAAKYAMQANTEALARQIQELGRIIGSPGLASQFLIEQQKLKHLQVLAESKGNNTYFFPENGLIPTAKMMGDLFNVRSGHESNIVIKDLKNQEELKEDQEDQEDLKDLELGAKELEELEELEKLEEMEELKEIQELEKLERRTQKNFRRRRSHK
jgi:regulator of protease activity HflC (stomatin/prohibitin superfamily)